MNHPLHTLTVASSVQNMPDTRMPAPTFNSYTYITKIIEATVISYVVGGSMSTPSILLQTLKEPTRVNTIVNQVATILRRDFPYTPTTLAPIRYLVSSYIDGLAPEV